MDIHSAEAHVQKVNRYLEELLKENPSLYNKTRTRLGDLSKELFRGVQLIADILMEDTLMSEDRSEDKNLTIDLKSIQLASEATQTKLDGLSQLVTPLNSTKSATSDISSGRKKHIISSYGKILRGLSESDISYLAVSECAHLLWKWYNLRFFQNNTNFHYNITKLPDWIKYIVIAYSKHLQDGTLSQFLTSFNTWLTTLSISDSKQYAVPYEVFNIANGIPPEYCTVEAIMIWEILFEKGLLRVNQLDLHEAPINSETIYNLFCSMNSPVVDRYVYYKDDDSLLRSYDRREVYMHA